MEFNQNTKQGATVPKKGFSLVEMLVAIIAISCIVAAFAPVMTKNLKKKVAVDNSSSSGGNSRLFLVNSSDCSPVAGQNYVKCNFTVPKGVTKLNAILVSGGGGGGGGIAGGGGGEYVIGTYTSGSVVIPNNINKIKINYLVGPGGPSGIATFRYFSNIAARSACKTNYEYMPIGDSSQDYRPSYICVPRLDIGEGSLPVPTRYAQFCTKAVGTELFDKTVCDTGIAKAICEYYGDRLPTIEEIAAIVKYDNSRLKFGTRTSNNYCPSCYVISNKYNDTRTQAITKEYYGFTKPGYGFASVICVQGDASYYFFSGGGGAAGGAIENYVIPQDAATSLAGATLSITAGTTPYNILRIGNIFVSPYVGGGYQIENFDEPYPGNYLLYQPGGLNSNGDAVFEAINATNSTINITRSGSTLLSFNAPYGTPGRGSLAGSSCNNTSCLAASVGQGGTSRLATMANYTGKSLPAIDSFRRNANGSNGLYATSATTTISGGEGGYYSFANCGKGSRGNKAYFNGTSLIEDSPRHEQPNLAQGCASVTLYGEYAGAPGGGGGSGTKARLRAIPVKPQQKITVYVGRAGSGGEIGYAGTAGGLSRIDVGSSYYYTTGGAGGAKGVAQTASAAAAPGAAGARGSGAGNLSGYLGEALGYGGYATAGSLNVSAGLGYGGNGGSSPFAINTSACGGQQATAPCNNTTLNGKNLEFREPGDIFANTGVYGLAGAGGGGGGWKKTGSAAGKGGNGQDGYVYLYWNND